MNIKKISQNLIYTGFKSLWAVFCYITALILALVSGFFTTIFYTDGSSGNDLYALGLMAICLEFIKIVFSIGYPFLKKKDRKSKNTVLMILRICFILSILASMNYLLLGGDITRSPAAKTIEMLYINLPFLYIIPLKLSQFFGTASLVLLIEFFIIYLPILAPIMFYEKVQSKSYHITNLDKLKEIVVTVPEVFIDNLHKRVMKYIEDKKIEPSINIEEITQNEDTKPKLKLLKSENYIKFDKPSNNDLEKDRENQPTSNTGKLIELEPNNDQEKDAGNQHSSNIDKSIEKPQNTFQDKDTEIEGNQKSLIDENTIQNPVQEKAVDILNAMRNKIPIKSSISMLSNDSNLFQDKDTEETKNIYNLKVLKAIYKLSENNNCPSVKTISAETGYTKNTICDVKKELERAGIIETTGMKTVILCDYKQAIDNLSKIAVNS